MASINDLDNPLLLLIFNRLSTQKLITAGHVCVRWNAMGVNSAQARTELVLLIGNETQRYIDESVFKKPDRKLLVDENGDVMFPEKDQSNSQLKIQSCPLDFPRFLNPHFTNLTALTICSQVYTKELNSITRLLKQLKQRNASLRTLKLYSNSSSNRNREFNKNPNLPAYVRMLSAVNSIGSLRSLTLDVNAKFPKNSGFFRIDFPILAKLEELEFNTADEQFVCLRDSITRYAVNNQGLRRIGIHLHTYDFNWLLELPLELSSRFTHLNFRLNIDNNAIFADLCGRFSRLTSLEITVHRNWHYTILGLFRALRNLKNLISLVINLGEGDIVGLHNRSRTMNFELPSLKVLTINYTGWHKNHQFFHKCNMHRVLPIVQVIQIVRVCSLCRSCHVKLVSSTSLTRTARAAIDEHCARHMFRAFVSCQRLRMVCTKVVGNNQVGTQYRQWHWNEMEPFGDEMIEMEEDEEEDEN